MKDQKSDNENKGPSFNGAQERVYESLKNEIREIRLMQMNDGQPSGELKALDDEAWKQLESRLSDEDQYVISLLFLVTYLICYEK